MAGRPGSRRDPDGIYETTDAVSLRVGPGTDRCRFRVLAAGTRLRVVGKEGAWRGVALADGGRAYVHGDFLRIMNDSTDSEK